jgi:hypothetical protein
MGTDPRESMPSPSMLSRRDALKAGAAGMAWLFSLGHITPAIAAELTQLANNQPMTGERLAGIIQDERMRWNALLAQIDPARMEEPGVEGAWSMKELIAHLTWYERRLVETGRGVLGTGTFTRPDRAMSLDEQNERIAAESRSRPPADVLAEADQVFGQLLDLIKACPTDILNDPHRLGLPDDFVPWMGVANNSYAHYREHELAVRAWLARSTATKVS